MWFLLLLYAALFEQVIIEVTSQRLYLKDGDGPCEGYPKIYNDNAWGYLGDSVQNSNTEKVVCKTAQCGELNSIEDVSRDIDGTTWLNEVNCTGAEDQLWNCTFPGWGTSVYLKPTVKKVKCSYNIKIDLEGDECAGPVRYSTDGGKTTSGYLCFDKFATKAADHICESLGCGNSLEDPSSASVASNQPIMKVNCPEKMDFTNLWQCVTQEAPKCEKAASVTCTGYKRLQLSGNSTNACSGRLQKEDGENWTDIKLSDLKHTADELCHKMHCGGLSVNSSNNDTQLTCSGVFNIQPVGQNRPSQGVLSGRLDNKYDARFQEQVYLYNVKVILKDNSTSCYGSVYMKVNDTEHPVCGTKWNPKNAEKVCSELKCGKLVNTDFKPSRTSQGWIMDEVDCKGKESSLWHCKAKRDPKTCQSHAYVICEGSVNARLVDGPGKCAGRLEIHFEGEWQNVDKAQWVDSYSNVVCQQLKCGDARKSEKFSMGSSPFLRKKITCNAGVKHISECTVKELSNSQGDREAVGIICEEHKVAFLEGKKSCSGKVRIEKGDVISWVSGSNETWNNDTANTVCRQMHCGEAQSFNHTPPSNKNKRLIESYKCSSNTTSLFDCETSPLSSDSNATIATVTCSGKINVNLTNKCWGMVNVCMGGECGGVCKNTWTDNMSESLCKELGCGNISLKSYKQESSVVIVKSLHSPKNAAKLANYNFVKNDDNDKTFSQNPAYVVCSGSIKPKLDTFGDKCSGNVLLSYEDKWLPVCKEALKDKDTRDAICKELDCGDAVNSTDYWGHPTEKKQISQLQYTSNDLKKCVAEEKSCPLGGLQCSERRTITLNDACTGAVYVKSQEEKNIVPVSAEGFSKKEGEKLCKDLKCGALKLVAAKNPSETLWNKSFNCTGVGEEGKIWDCEKPQASTQKQQAVIECEEKPNINISGGCYGQVKINGLEVCNRKWEDKYSHMVCQEKGCGNAIIDRLHNSNPVSSTEYHHVHCEDFHHKIGQCKRFKARCEGKGKLVSVYCTGNVKFRTTSICGGQIEVNYRDTWEKLLEFPVRFKKKLCEELNCTDVLKSEPQYQKQEVTMDTSVECQDGTLDFKYCVQKKDPISTKKPAEIYCQGYEPPSTQERAEPFPTVSVIVGVGFLLVVVVLTIIFVRMCLIRRAKSDSLRMFPRKEVEFESGDMDDFHNKSNEMEDFRRGRFRSDSEVIAGHDARSNSSYPYDDIDEMEEGRPLTSQADTDAASGDYMPMPDNGVTYEVDDPQENYDDIEASPEVTQTKAQVYNTPKSPTESVAVAPPGLPKGDEDYLVPGQDG
ncbi:antigen WC1.1 [Scomber japonicus]|uniref:antigen WC1.1 n=1 Tax=Scomber japonicus TaxID=13676 RepID=UPI0023051698|nr:antigen WC1.1 [Scomber japonicus]